MLIRFHFWVPFNITMPTIGPLLTGDPNPFYPLVLFCNDNTPKNQKPRTDGSQLDRYSLDGQTYHYHVEFDDELFNLEVCGLIIQQGGDVESYPLWAKVDPQDLIPGEGDELPTWQDFLDQIPTADFLIIGDDHYVATSVLSNENDYLLVSHAIGIFGFENLRTISQIKALQAVVPDEGGDE